MSDVRAMVQTGIGELELQRFPRPVVGENDGLLKIEACGICGTDYETLDGAFPLALPVIPGHEPVGTIEEIGPRAAARWGVEVGDRVVVQSDFGCGRCSGCFDGQQCLVSPGSHGFMPVQTPPALWGGYADYMYLAPGSVPHKISSEIEPRIAALYNPLGAGFAWAHAAPDLQYGDSIAILGPGQRGLACVIAARACGASRIFVTGLERDAHKLALAREFGADVTIEVEREDPVARIREETNGRGVDAVVDTTPHATRPVVDAVHIARPGGTIVLAGLKGRNNRVPDFPSDEVAMRYQTIKGVRAVDYHSFQRAVRLIESGAPGLEKMHTHEFPLQDAVRAVRTLAGETGAGAVSVTIEPGL